MRIQLASDLHLEFLAKAGLAGPTLAPVADADLLVLAGDIANGLDAVKLFDDWPVPVLYVAGNHEFYGRRWERTRAELRQAARGTQVVFLDNDVADVTGFGSWTKTHAVELARTRFLGATLWTDYRLRTGLSQSQNMAAAMRSLSDHQVIASDTGRRFTAEQAMADHEASLSWLDHELAKPFDGKTVVGTHHGPHQLSVHPRYQQPATKALNAAFVSDLATEMRQVDLWLHGHMHDSSTIVSDAAGWPPTRGAIRLDSLRRTRSSRIRHSRRTWSSRSDACSHLLTAHEVSCILYLYKLTGERHDEQDEENGLSGARPGA